MIFTDTALPGVVKVEIEPARDERGFFARCFCGEEFAARGLPARFEQSSLSRNSRAGTLRGMHFQEAPHAEAKFVRCTRGGIVDVVVDLRADSPTHRRWLGETLTDENNTGLFIPPGCAHGFLTLADDTDVLYQITPAFKPGFGRGVRWNDPAFGIEWPRLPTIISERDAGYPDYRS